MRHLLFCLASLAVSPPAIAGEHIPGRPYLHNHQYLARSCESIDFNLDKAQCYTRFTAQLDSAIDAGVNRGVAALRTMPHYNPSQATKLRAAQAAWLSYRRAQCHDVIGVRFARGSGGDVSMARCMYDKAVLRALDVSRWY